MRGYIRNALQQKIKSDGWPKVPLVVGSSGTVRALVKLLRRHAGKRTVKKAGFDLKDLIAINEEMSSMNTSQLLNLQGMEPKRVDMILAGSILLEEVMTALSAKRALPTDFSLRDGILLEELKLVREHKTSRIELHLEDLYLKAAHYGGDPLHTRRVVEFAETLFDKLAKLHRLPSSWRVYLTATVILRNIGDLVSISNHAKHTFYIVKNSDFPSMQDWENDFIAKLCLLHADGKIEAKDLSFAKDKQKLAAFTKLVAILRLVDALDLGAKSRLKLSAVRIERSLVRITVSGRSTAGLESLFIERKKTLFEETFKKKLELKTNK
jgi:exopolyphosphatase/guanosine-5'-triphosphate,3'-diphosphate pyrophosphatase